jgi:hypothetical protein
MKNFTRKELTTWISQLKDQAADDEKFNVSYFPGTKDSKVCIIGGWSSGFSTEYEDLVCVSASDPTKFMAVTIVKKPDHDLFRELDAFEPAEEDLRIALEWEDDPEAIACFYEMEWERLAYNYLEV